MDEVEAMAGRKPLWAKTLLLSTLAGEDQVREEFAKAVYGAVPKVKRSTFKLDQLANIRRLSTKNGIAEEGIEVSNMCRTSLMLGIEMGRSGTLRLFSCERTFHDFSFTGCD